MTQKAEDVDLTLDEIKMELRDLLIRIDGCRDVHCPHHGVLIERIDALGSLAQDARRY